MWAFFLNLESKTELYFTEARIFFSHEMALIRNYINKIKCKKGEKINNYLITRLKRLLYNILRVLALKAYLLRFK